MQREELLKSKEYWTTKIQLSLFELIETYMKENNLNRTQLAEKLGVSKGYITQVLNGDFDHKVSKLVELALACGKVPVLEYESVRDYISDDARGIKRHEGTKHVYIHLNYATKTEIRETYGPQSIYHRHALNRRTNSRMVINAMDKPASFKAHSH